jgi:hypothetical protein
MVFPFDETASDTLILDDECKNRVIGGSTTYTLSVGEYTPGSYALLGAGYVVPTIFIVENGVLAIDDNGYGQFNEVSFASSILLCGNGTFRIRNSRYRYTPAYDYQYSFAIWAAQQSHVLYEGAEIVAVPKYQQDANPDVHGHFGIHWLVPHFQ